MSSDKPLIITRTFDAPLEKVWKAWTEPEEVKKWWGPANFTAPSVEIDFRVGGKYLYCMRGAIEPGSEEQDFWSTGVYKEIEPMKKIVATDCFADEKGNVVSAEAYGMKGFAMELLVTITFEATEDGKTKLTLKHEGLPTEGDMLENTELGWNQSLDKFANALQ
jgi:uncharacterized protein YndB with AHSA1/START domain